MFDIGFSELLIFGAIALIILGPEKLPLAARSAGKWYAKAHRTLAKLQSELESELDLAETRKIMQQELDAIRATEASMQKELSEMRGNIQKFQLEQNQAMSNASEITPSQNSTDLQTQSPQIKPPSEVES